MQLAAWLAQAALALQQLQRLDPQVQDLHFEAARLAADVLDFSPAQLPLWQDKILDPQQLQSLNAALARRCQGEPLAYITGRWWFWDLELEVAPCTLIPRPDTELLVEQALSLPLPPAARVLDLGTGTGAIALALAKARPAWQVSGLDLNPDAVALARRNQQRLSLNNVRFLQSNWFDAVQGEQFDLILSNPPYIDVIDPHLQQGDVRFEPASALIAAEQGMADLRKIIGQSRRFLSEQGWIWLEHGYQQAQNVRSLLQDVGLSQVSSKQDFGGQWRISGGCVSLK